MIFAKISDESVAEYPVTESGIREKLNNVSLPETITTEVANYFGFFEVLPSSKPDYDPLKEKIKEGTPELIGDVWVQTWIVTDMSDQEVYNLVSRKSEEVRKKRNQLLSESDWTQLPDSPVNLDEWKVYRQLLREIPLQQNFPHDVSWPVKPS